MVSYALGPYVLDLQAGELRRGSEQIPLAPKVFDLLAYLAKNPGRLVGHEELLDALWPDIAVSAASVTRAVADLRRALGDTARDPQYVQTVPRRGYRLLARVREVEAGETSRAPFCLLHQGRPYALQFGENILGRADESVVPIFSPAVSRHHARMSVTRAAVTVEDLGSKNGTHVRGVRIAELTRLADGDEIRVGPIELIFRDWPRDAPTVTS